MWAAYLNRRTEAGQALLAYGTLVTCDAGRGIDDAAWQPSPGAAAGEDEADGDLDHDDQDGEAGDGRCPAEAEA